MRCTVLVVVAAASLVGGCGAGDEPAPSPEAVRVGPESVAVVEREAIATGPALSGALRPAKEATVRAEVGGTVAAAPFEVGQAVRRGQVMVRIDAPDLLDAVQSARIEVASAQTSLRLARQERERTQALVEGGALARRDLENADSVVAGAEAQLAAARARLASAQARAADMVVEAPISGIVSVRSAQQGDVVAPGGELFTLVDPSNMRLEASVPSDAVAAVRVGTPVEFTLRGYGEQTFTGRVERVSPVADPATGQVQVFVEIPNPEGRIVAGLYAEGRLNVAAHEGLVVPASAVDESDGRPTVTRLRDGRTERVSVTLGARDERDERVEVTAGLSEGDVVLTGPARSIAPATPVMVDGRRG